MLSKDAFRVKQNQHAFCRSTVSALVNITQTWLNDSDNTTEGKKAIQQVKLPGVLSTTCTCSGGVPQGSVISPLLFGIFIDDFDDSILVEMQGRVKMSKYADDCTASESIPNGELSNMQKVLDGLPNWATTNNIFFFNASTLYCKTLQSITKQNIE